LLNKLSFVRLNDSDIYFNLSSRCGLDFNIGKYSAWDVVDMIYNFSNKNLSSKEKAYLEPIAKLIKQRKTPADILLDCNIENARELVNFL